MYLGDILEDRSTQRNCGMPQEKQRFEVVRMVLRVISVTYFVYRNQI